MNLIKFGECDMNIVVYDDILRVYVVLSFLGCLRQCSFNVYF